MKFLSTVEEDNLPMNNSEDYEVVNSSEGESTDAVEIDEENNEDHYNRVNNGESVNNIENSNNSEIEIVNNDNNLLSSQISEINNKISFIMNQMNKEDGDENTSENNVHDIILFIIFGVLFY